MAHGHCCERRKSPEYSSWLHMRARCLDPNCKEYPRYGARGIRVAPEWADPNGFSQFLEHVGPKPTPRHTIDRIDVNGHYEPGNVRWLTHAEQQRNRRDNHLITIGGRTMCLTAWSQETGINECTLRHRLRAGLTPEVAISRPINIKCRGSRARARRLA